MLAFFILALSPSAFAQWSVINCDSVRSGDRLQVTVRFTNAESGRIIVDNANGFPPVSIVSQPFAAQISGGSMQLTSRQDGQFKYQAHLTLPANPSSGKKFNASLTVTRTSGSPIQATLECQAK